MDRQHGDRLVVKENPSFGLERREMIGTGCVVKRVCVDGRPRHAVSSIAIGVAGSTAAAVTFACSADTVGRIRIHRCDNTLHHMCGQYRPVQQDDLLAVELAPGRAQ
eukprot:CAMPEP_0184971562 /NCGR_PEP_ID=MMETSP1098-20130426/3782_1 /TAXON_ID=89044 /ORGANISM="Spumella elongata, Strain CCAP 955/1" /LENGTH=106 /DNA_ID=CAMNT_0027493711 /DNA_START=66 /DNA_END=383 /DNA_ORIENTATION=+